MTTSSKFREKITQNLPTYLAELNQIVNQKSLSTKKEGIQEMAQMIEQMLKDSGFKTELLTVDHSNPYILAEIGKGDTTLLFYNHYDTQPADDTELWKTEPFKLTEKEGKLYARGVADNKGNLILRLQAFRLIQETLGKIPVKIIWIIEGEEEVGSGNLEKFSETYGHRWEKADLCIWEDGGVDTQGRPLVKLGQKGAYFAELYIKMGEKDLHSRNASMVDSATWRLIHALATLRDVNGNVTIDGLNKYITPPTPEEDEMTRKLDFDMAATLKALHRNEYIKKSQKKEEVLKTHYYSHTCNIDGIWSGYTEPGKVKSIIPNEATAKIDIRLTDTFDVNKVHALLRKHLDKRGFNDVEIKDMVKLQVAKSDSRDPFVQRTIEILRTSYGKEPQVEVISGGSGPQYSVAGKFGISKVDVGCENPDSSLHGPNENIVIEDYVNGMVATIDLVLGLAK
ncbi:MAG: M20/M25/M40 family metallo-hydrolase [Candidatus Dojkabacteria bacterium]